MDAAERIVERILEGFVKRDGYDLWRREDSYVQKLCQEWAQIIREETALKYTSEPPTEHGMYWAIDDTGEERQVLLSQRRVDQIARGVLCHGWQWAGPIQKPEGQE